MNARGGQVPDRDPALLPGRKRGRGPQHHRAGGRGGQVHDRGVPHRGQQSRHDPGGPGDRLGGQLDLDRPDLPRVRAAVDAGPVDLRVRHVFAAAGRGLVGAQPPFGMPPRPAVRPGLPGGQPQPGGQHRADVRQAGQGRASRGEAEPGGRHPVPGQPAPARARAEPPGGDVPAVAPPGRDLFQPLRVDAQRLGEQVVRDPVVLAAEQEPVDVALAEPHRRGGAAPRPAMPGSRPGMAAARQFRRGDDVVLCLCRHDVPKYLPQ